jgi:hypothetical protein
MLAVLGMLGTGFAVLAEVVRRMWLEQKSLTKHSVKCEKALIKAQGDIALLEQKVIGLTSAVVDKAAVLLAEKILWTAKGEAESLIKTSKDAAEDLRLNAAAVAAAKVIADKE